ncbi:MAG: hypothetical protein IT381_13745 [Deltaproteobacteria bacterium]|nr:hypothetical protein [Deltaproteobacteria bacterium]
MVLNQAHDSDGLWLGHTGRLVLQVWGSNVVESDIVAVGGLFRRLSAESAGLLATVSIIRPKSLPKISPEVRRLVDEMTKQNVDSVGASANIVEGSGFIAAGARAILTGMLIFDKKTRTFSSVQDAVKWIQGMALMPMDGAQMTEAIEEARSRATRQGG